MAQGEQLQYRSDGPFRVLHLQHFDRGAMIVAGAERERSRRAASGFDFLGYDFGPEGPTVAKTTVSKFVERAVRK